MSIRSVHSARTVRVRGPPHQQRVSQRVGGGEQQQAAGIGGQSADAPLKGLFDAARQRERARKAEPTC
jgi:hypothetical protein